MDIFEAAAEGDLKRVGALVEQDGGLVHAEDIYGGTPLFRAALFCDIALVWYLLSAGANVNHRDHIGGTPLHEACDLAFKGIVSLLLENGADIAAVTHSGLTVLSVAAFNGTDVAVRSLLERDASNVDAVNNEARTALHRACEQGRAVVVRQLLEAGADPTLRDKHGRTAVDLAAGNGHQGRITILEEWERAYTLTRVRRIRDATSITAPATSQRF